MRPRRELLRLVAENGETVEALKRSEIPRALKGKGAAPTLDRLLGWMDLGSLDGDGGRRLKS